MRFVSVTVLAGAVVPTRNDAKDRLVGFDVNGAVATPESVTICGLFAAVSVNVNVPFSAPTAIGAKRTNTEQLAPGATLAHPFPVISNCVDATTLDTVSVPVVLFVSLTVFA